MLALTPDEVKKEIERIISFIHTHYARYNKQTAVIAVSGGIDSAVSHTLLTKALGSERVHPLFLPFADQDTEDAKAVVTHTKTPESQWHQVNIEPMVAAFTAELLPGNDRLRSGNIMARCRMIVVYDLAKRLDALVCGTENKSEKYLGYFTRFGDEASDLEPLQHLYKTNIRQLAQALEIPQQILDKAPSAGLWQEQSDERELGFSYEQGDKVLEQYVDRQEKEVAKIVQATGVAVDIVEKVIARVKSQHFKHEVPYTIEE